MGSDSEGEKSVQKEREKKKMLALSPIAKPLAGKKLSKKTLKLVRRGIIYVKCDFLSSYLLVSYLRCCFCYY